MSDTLRSRTTYFLGAGASAAVTDRVVVTRNLLEVLIKESPPSASRRDWELAYAFVRSFARLPDFVPSIDDVLSVIDVALVDDLPLSDRWPPGRLVEVRQSLERLIYECIENHVHAYEPLEGPWFTFLKNSCIRDRSPLITLNWDCLAERALERLTGNGAAVDYAVSCITPRGDVVRPSPGACLVLKPHGSLSWGHCPLCQGLVVDVAGPCEFANGRPCPHCPEAALRLVLVPPAPYNRSRPWFLPALWDRIEQTIYDSDRLIIIGYSLAPQDVHVRMRLVRAVARRAARPRARPLEIEVITREDARTAELEHRFQSALGGLLDSRKLQVRALQNGFLEWVAQGGVA